jgi:hypothetical protein
MAEEIEEIRRGGDGYIVVWGGVSLWRSLMRLDLIDELQLSLFPYVAGEGTRLFDGVPKSYRLDLVSSTASSNGIVELLYRRHREPSGPLRNAVATALTELGAAARRDHALRGHSRTLAHTGTLSLDTR